MREPYNTTCDIWNGPEGEFGTPLTVREMAVPCRRVVQTQISANVLEAFALVAWLTMDDLFVVTPYWSFDDIASVGTVYFRPADLVSVPSGVPPQYYVWGVEYVYPTVGSLYQRVWIAPLPYGS